MKPRALVLGAAGLAASVALVLRVLRWATGHEPDPTAPAPPPPRTWARLYRQNRRVVDAWGRGYGLRSVSLATPELSGPAEQAGLVPFPPTREELFEIVASAVDGATQSSIVAMLVGPEGQFLIRVWVPCLVLYRKPPGQLLRRARAGDDDAFEDLLRLDKSVISDPVLWRRWHGALNDMKPARRKRFRDAMAGRPTKRFDAKTIRIAFAGLLSQVAKREGCEMTAPEVRKWFAAFAEGGYLSDQAMPGGEALTKAIQRNRDWPAGKRPSPDPDNKS